jgi:hypothetical protein
MLILVLNLRDVEFILCNEDAEAEYKYIGLASYLEADDIGGEARLGI